MRLVEHERWGDPKLYRYCAVSFSLEAHHHLPSAANYLVPMFKAEADRTRRLLPVEGEKHYCIVCLVA